MIIVTGGLGFIGFNLIKKLNQKNTKEIIIVDDLKKKNKNINNSKNLKKIKYEKVIDFRDSIRELKKIKREIKCIFHNGANSNTTCWDAKDIMEKNYIYSKNLLNFATKNKIDFIYASSASVYGNNGRVLIEDPLNLYAVSKLIFDNYVKDFISNNKKKNSKVIGLRYFNVYGPYEDHKTNMSSPVLSFVNQIKKKRQIKLFGSTKNVNFKKFTRDFIHIDDICNINYKFYSSKKKINGIYDVGSGVSTSFYKIALILKKWYKQNKSLNIKIKIINFPKNLKNFYQFYTKSKNLKIKTIFKNYKFIKISKGVEGYSKFLENLKND